MEKYRDGVSFSYTKMYKARNPENPLILIYTIDKDSEVSGQSKQPRENLFSDDQEKHHVIGLAIAFLRQTRQKGKDVCTSNRFLGTWRIEL